MSVHYILLLLYAWRDSGIIFHLLGATYAVQRVLRAAGFARGLEWERPGAPPLPVSCSAVHHQLAVCVD